MAVARATDARGRDARAGCRRARPAARSEAGRDHASRRRGPTPAEVCSILNISAKEQRLLLHRARAFVRARLEEYFNTRHPTHGRIATRSRHDRAGNPAIQHFVARRLMPLYIAVFLQGFLLWVPVEKLFMSEIGFDPASVGLMAAAYAAVVPIIEIPEFSPTGGAGGGADHLQRRAGLCALIGGLSNNVATYIVSALILGVYFAMYSGTLDAVVYDTVLEEIGDSDDFERRIGRVRLVESIALVASSLLGGWLAGLATPRLMYFLSVPIAALSIFAYLWFREPRLHKTEEATSLRSHLAVTYRTSSSAESCSRSSAWRC